MKYLLTLWGDESVWTEMTPEETAADMARWDAFTAEVSAAGVLAGGEGLQPTSTATTIRRRGDEHLVTDGPFAETKEQLGGYYLLDVDGIEAALDWARKLPLAADASVEVRPVIPMDPPAA